MKKVIICLAATGLVFSMQASAQIQKGNLLVGGDIANFNLGLDGGGNFSAQIDPKVAWFVRDNLAIGGYLSLGINTAKGNGTSVSYGVGSLARYYLSSDAINVLRNSRFFLEGTIGIAGDNPAVGNNTNGLGLGIGPGWTYFITPNVGLEALLKYNGIVGFGSKPTSNDLGLSVGFQIYLPTARLKKIAKDVSN
ncbi:MAG: hypothetical protein ABW019_15745 [Chitinophagaceae bacterium]